MNSNKSVRPWFSDSDIPFEENDPCYFEREQYNFPWMQELESQWLIVRDELNKLLREDESAITPYPKQSMVTRPGKWRTIAFMFWSFKFQENIALCPRTWELVKDIPGLTAVSFNMLEEHTSIKPHRGDTNVIARCHMGVDIPARAPRCGFRVGNETRSWEEGRFLMFNDAHEHTAWNNTNFKRYILVIDVMRPEFALMKDATCSRVLGTIKQEVLCEDNPWVGRIFNNKLGKFVLFNYFRMLVRIMIFARNIRLSPG